MSHIIESFLAKAKQEVTIVLCEQTLEKFERIKNFSQESANQLQDLFIKLEELINQILSHKKLVEESQIAMITKVYQLQILIYIILFNKEKLDFTKQTELLIIKKALAVIRDNSDLVQRFLDTVQSYDEQVLKICRLILKIKSSGLSDDLTDYVGNILNSNLQCDHTESLSFLMKQIEDECQRLIGIGDHRLPKDFLLLFFNRQVDENILGQKQLLNFTYLLLEISFQDNDEQEFKHFYQKAQSICNKLKLTFNLKYEVYDFILKQRQITLSNENVELIAKLFLEFQNSSLSIRHIDILFAIQELQKTHPVHSLLICQLAQKTKLQKIGNLTGKDRNLLLPRFIEETYQIFQVIIKIVSSSQFDNPFLIKSMNYVVMSVFKLFEVTNQLMASKNIKEEQFQQYQQIQHKFLNILPNIFINYDQRTIQIQNLLIELSKEILKRMTNLMEQKQINFQYRATFECFFNFLFRYGGHQDNQQIFKDMLKYHSQQGALTNVLAIQILSNSFKQITDNPKERQILHNQFKTLLQNCLQGDQNTSEIPLLILMNEFSSQQKRRFDADFLNCVLEILSAGVEFVREHIKKSQLCCYFFNEIINWMIEVSYQTDLPSQDRDLIWKNSLNIIKSIHQEQNLQYDSKILVDVIHVVLKDVQNIEMPNRVFILAVEVLLIIILSEMKIQRKDICRQDSFHESFQKDLLYCTTFEVFFQLRKHTVGCLKDSTDILAHVLKRVTVAKSMMPFSICVLLQAQIELKDQDAISDLLYLVQEHPEIIIFMTDLTKKIDFMKSYLNFLKSYKNHCKKNGLSLFMPEYLCLEELRMHTKDEDIVETIQYYKPILKKFHDDGKSEQIILLRQIVDLLQGRKLQTKQNQKTSLAFVKQIQKLIDSS